MDPLGVLRRQQKRESHCMTQSKPSQTSSVVNTLLSLSFSQGQLLFFSHFLKTLSIPAFLLSSLAPPHFLTLSGASRRLEFAF